MVRRTPGISCEAPILAQASSASSPCSTASSTSSKLASMLTLETSRRRALRSTYDSCDRLQPMRQSERCQRPLADSRATSTAPTRRVEHRHALAPSTTCQRRGALRSSHDLSTHAGLESTLPSRRDAAHQRMLVAIAARARRRADAITRSPERARPASASPTQSRAADDGRRARLTLLRSANDTGACG